MISKAKASIDSRPKLQSELTSAGILDNSPDPNPLTKPGKKLRFGHCCCIAMVYCNRPDPLVRELTQPEYTGLRSPTSLALGISSLFLLWDFCSPRG
jgi:hypothetical protein